MPAPASGIESVRASIGTVVAFVVFVVVTVLVLLLSPLGLSVAHAAGDRTVTPSTVNGDFSA